MNHVVIVHGFKGTPTTNWKPWLKKELEQKGLSVDVPEMPDTDRPIASAWNVKLSKTVDIPNTQTFLVGHCLEINYLQSS